MTLEHAPVGTLPAGLVRLARQLPYRRKRQAFVLFVLAALAAIAELAMIGLTFLFIFTLTARPGASGPAMLRPVKEMLTSLSPSEPMLAVGGAFAAAAIGSGVIRLVALWAANGFASRTSRDLADHYFSNVLAQPYPFHLATNSADVIAGVQKVHTVNTQILLPLVQSVTNLASAAAIAIGLFILDWRASGVAVIFLLFAYFVVMRISRGGLGRNSRLIAANYNRRVEAIQESLGMIREIIVNRSQRLHQASFARANRTLFSSLEHNALVAGAPRYVIEPVGLTAIAVLAIVFDRYDSSIEHVMALLGTLALSCLRMLPLVQGLFSYLARMDGSRQELFDVLRILELEPAAGTVPATAIEPLPFENAIQFDTLTFRHQGKAEPVLRDVTLAIQRGDRVGILGNTGSGKTTLIDLLMGLLQPAEGSIKIDGVTLEPSLLNSWQANIAQVSQSVFLVDGTVGENITMGAGESEIDEGKLRTVIEQAQLTRFLADPNVDLSDKMGERGMRISGGQRQRIGLARALYRDAPVLVLDEATSALDATTEEAVLDAVFALPRDRTILAIAHGPAILSRCDYVYRIADGEVEGPFRPDEIPSMVRSV